MNFSRMRVRESAANAAQRFSIRKWISAVPPTAGSPLSAWATDMPPELLARRTDLLKDRVAAEVKKFLGKDFKRIGRTLKIVDYAGKIQRSEGGDPAIVTLAAFLSAVAGGASAGLNASARQLSAEEITEAQSILLRTGASEELTREVLAILNSLGAKRPADENNFKCVYDAIRIADLAEALKAQSPQAGNSAMDGPLLTQTGKNMMKEIVDQSSLVLKVLTEKCLIFNLKIEPVFDPECDQWQRCEK